MTFALCRPDTTYGIKAFEKFWIMSQSFSSPTRTIRRKRFFSTSTTTPGITNATAAILSESLIILWKTISSPPIPRPSSSFESTPRIPLGGRTWRELSNATDGISNYKKSPLLEYADGSFSSSVTGGVKNERKGS